MSQAYLASTLIPDQMQSPSNIKVEKVLQTPKSITLSKKKPPPSINSDVAPSLNFSNVGNSIIMRKTDYYNPQNAQIVSNKRLFSKIGGLGPVNIGNEDWVRAKER